MVTPAVPRAAVKVLVVAFQLAFPKVNETDPFGKNAGPSPNSAKTAGSTNVTSKVPRKDPVPFGMVLSKAPPSCIVPETRV